MASNVSNEIIAFLNKIDNKIDAVDKELKTLDPREKKSGRVWKGNL